MISDIIVFLILAVSPANREKFPGNPQLAFFLSIIIKLNEEYFYFSLTTPRRSIASKRFND
jgi:hypothetical protein